MLCPISSLAGEWHEGKHNGLACTRGRMALSEAGTTASAECSTERRAAPSGTACAAPSRTANGTCHADSSSPPLPNERSHPDHGYPIHMTPRDFVLELLMAFVVCALAVGIAVAFRTHPILTVAIGLLTVLSVALAVFLDLRRFSNSSASGPRLVVRTGIILGFLIGAPLVLWLLYCSC